MEILIAISNVFYYRRIRYCKAGMIASAPENQLFGIPRIEVDYDAEGRQVWLGTAAILARKIAFSDEIIYIPM
jgi:hypothetical protein